MVISRSCRHSSTARCTLAALHVLNMRYYTRSLDGRACHFATNFPGLLHGQSFVSLQVQQALATVAMVADGGMPKPEAMTATWRF